MTYVPLDPSSVPVQSYIEAFNRSQNFKPTPLRAQLWYGIYSPEVKRIIGALGIRRQGDGVVEITDLYVEPTRGGVAAYYSTVQMMADLARMGIITAVMAFARLDARPSVIRRTARIVGQPRAVLFFVEHTPVGPVAPAPATA